MEEQYTLLIGCAAGLLVLGGGCFAVSRRGPCKPERDDDGGDGGESGGGGERERCVDAADDADIEIGGAGLGGGRGAAAGARGGARDADDDDDDRFAFGGRRFALLQDGDACADDAVCEFVIAMDARAPRSAAQLGVDAGEKLLLAEVFDDGWVLAENAAGRRGNVPLELLDGPFECALLGDARAPIDDDRTHDTRRRRSFDDRRPADDAFDFYPGDRVEAAFYGGAKYYPGVITRVRGDGSYDIDYDDGDREERVPREHVRPARLGRILGEDGASTGGPTPARREAAGALDDNAEPTRPRRKSSIFARVKAAVRWRRQPRSGS